MRKLLISIIMGPLLAVQGAYAQAPSDEATVVADVQVAAPSMVPVPDVGRPAPLYSVEALQGFACEVREQAFDEFGKSNGVRRGGSSAATSDFGRRNPDTKEMWSLEFNIVANSALRASELTRAAERVRREARQGLRTQKEVEDAELARQEGVREYQRLARNLWVREMLDPERGPPGRVLGQPHPKDKLYNPGLGYNPNDPTWVEAINLASGNGVDLGADTIDGPLVRRDGEADTTIERVAIRKEVERGKPVLIITGVMRNIRSRTVTAQGLLITVLDQSDQILDMAVADSGRTRIRQGKAIRFSYRLENAPPYAHKVRVAFAVDDMFTPRRFAKCGQAPQTGNGAQPARNRLGIPEPGQRSRF